ncbi:hypothetical protein [Paenibacillus alkalitolerans]|uniref:hypothetical protein n=1 Tax=Paenibacillus alkalitolerans TaxID=2799335 RepID=UPI0018F714D5|nr:hypothetical protein [Paenibacillus alkalitolerans]
MKHRRHTRSNRSENMDNMLRNMKLSQPSERFSDRVMERVSSDVRQPVAVANRIPAEWKNASLAAAATLVFISSGITEKIASLNSAEVGSFIQVKVLNAVQYGIHLIGIM